MSRPFHLVTAVLAALTAVALLGAALALRPPGLPAEADGPREAANRALVLAFYDAANAAIDTGDPAPLAALLSPGFVDRDAPPGVDPGRDGLVGRLLTLRAAAPSVRLAAADVAADGDLVVARVRVDGTAAPPTFAGLTLVGAWPAWGPVDAFLVAGGKIVERRGPAAAPTLPSTLLRAELAVPPPASRVLAVARVALTPGARHDAAGLSGPRLLFAEAGALTVEPVVSDAAAPPTALVTGEHLVLPPGAGYAVRATDQEAAVVVDVAVVAAPYGGRPADAASPGPHDGVVTPLLADGLLVSVPTGPIVLSIGRARLGPDERLAWSATDGAVLLRVEAGSVDLAATGSVPWVRAASRQRTNGGVAASLDAGGGALLEAGAAAEVRAAAVGPVELLVVTLLPAEGGRGIVAKGRPRLLAGPTHPSVDLATELLPRQPGEVWSSFG